MILPIYYPSGSCWVQVQEQSPRWLPLTASVLPTCWGLLWAESGGFRFPRETDPIEGKVPCSLVSY